MHKSFKPCYLCPIPLPPSPSPSLQVLGRVGQSDDARVQRDTARALASLSVSEEIKGNIVNQGALPTLFQLARSLDIASQRYSTLALCNLASSPHKGKIVEAGAIRPLMFLARFPDMEIQRYAALALAGLALGDHGDNKVKECSPSPTQRNSARHLLYAQAVQAVDSALEFWKQSCHR